MVTPTMFPGDKKLKQLKTVPDKYVLIPSTNACYLTIAGYGFFFGRLRVPTIPDAALVVPADWEWWGHSNKERRSLPLIHI